MAAGGIADGEWSASVQALLTAIDQRASFFRGAQITLELGESSTTGELGRLRDALATREVHLRAVRGSIPPPQEQPRTSDCCRREGARAPATPEEKPASKAKRVSSSTHPSLRPQGALHGHVVVLGDVNPGAEIVAGANVIVWAAPRMVHAGAGGEDTAVVCALDLAPTQLRIGAHIAVSPDRKGKPRPETALIRDGQLVASLGDRRPAIGNQA